VLDGLVAASADDVGSAVEELLDLAVDGPSDTVEARAPDLLKRTEKAPSLQLETLIASAWGRHAAGECGPEADLSGRVPEIDAARADLLPLELRAQADLGARSLLGATRGGAIGFNEATALLKRLANCP